MPSTAADRATDIGILYASVVIRMVSSKVRSPATCPFILLKDNAQNKKKMGVDTTIAVKPRLFPTAE
jgi:hypothetical protein